MWQIDPDDRLPLYKQAVDLIEAAIASGHLAPGSRLPSERALARLLGINRSTVIHALDALADRGLLLRKRGSGTYVNTRKWGVLTYAQLHWQTPPPLLSGRKPDMFHREAVAMRDKAAAARKPFYDLFQDALSPDLLPQCSVPRLSWEQAVNEEQNEEAAHLGLAAFRRSVRWFLHTTVGLDVPFDHLLATAGSRQAIFLITQCLLRPGDAVGVESPSYFYSLPVFQAAGLRLYALPLDAQGVTPEGLEALASRRPLKMVFLNPVFHNPTGTVMGEARKRAVLDICAAKRIPIVEDDAYSQLFFTENADRRPLKAMDTREQVIYTGSLSSYAGRNVRAGWLVAPPGIIAKLAAARHMMDAGLSVLPQILAGEYLENVAARHLPYLRTELAARARQLAGFLHTRFADDLGFASPPGGLYIYAPLRETNARRYAAVQRKFLDCGIVPAVGEEFGDTRPSFRLNYSFFPA